MCGDAHRFPRVYLVLLRQQLNAPRHSFTDWAHPGESGGRLAVLSLAAVQQFAALRFCSCAEQGCIFFSPPTVGPATPRRRPRDGLVETSQSRSDEKCHSCRDRVVSWHRPKPPWWPRQDWSTGQRAGRRTWLKGVFSISLRWRAAARSQSRRSFDHVTGDRPGTRPRAVTEKGSGEFCHRPSDSASCGRAGS